MDHIENHTHSHSHGRSSGYREEIACALGLIFLIAATVVEKASGTSWWTHGLFTGAYIFAGYEVYLGSGRSYICFGIVKYYIING